MRTSVAPSACPAGSALRQAMRHVPTPVAVVTALSGDRCRGVTVGSLTSVSLAPSLVSFNLRRASRMYDVIRTAPHFAIHVLAEDQEALARRFSRPGLTGDEQFAALRYECNGHGVPVLTDTLAVLFCAAHAVQAAGDHVIVLGRTVQAVANPDRRPLLYFDRSYRSVGGPAVAAGVS